MPWVELLIGLIMFRRRAGTWCHATKKVCGLKCFVIGKVRRPNQKVIGNEPSAPSNEQRGLLVEQTENYHMIPNRKGGMYAI
jgi:hypothetical protein